MADIWILYNDERIFFEISKNANVHHLIIIGEQINAIDSRV